MVGVAGVVAMMSLATGAKKLLDTGFMPKYKVEDAIEEIAEKINSNILKNEKIHHNLKWMNENNFAYNKL